MENTGRNRNGDMEHVVCIDNRESVSSWLDSDTSMWLKMHEG